MYNQNKLIVVSEINEERYEVIDKLVVDSELKDFFKSVEKIQKTLMKHNIPQIYLGFLIFIYKIKL